MSSLALSVRNPADIFGNFETLFNQVYNEFHGCDFELSYKGYPRVDIYDADNELLIEASVPGLTKDEVRVDYQRGYIVICGDSTVDKTRNLEKYQHKELHRSTFCRSFRVSQDKFDIDKIDAKVENGLLKILIPKKDISKFETKQIKIK